MIELKGRIDCRKKKIEYRFRLIRKGVKDLIEKKGGNIQRAWKAGAASEYDS